MRRQYRGHRMRLMAGGVKDVGLGENHCFKEDGIG